MSTLPISQISTTLVVPASRPANAKERVHLTTWDINFISTPYIQMGNLFPKPESPWSMLEIFDRLERALAEVLVYYYPLAGRFVTEKVKDSEKGLFTYIDCAPRGVEFIRATAKEICVDDILRPLFVPHFVRNLFPLDMAVNLDGHTGPLVGFKVTELADGIFIGCSHNHAVGDGTSFWNFFNSFAEISRGVNPITKPPVHDRWFPDDSPPPIVLPFSNTDDFLLRFIPPESKVAIFHFSPESTADLKQKANKAGSNNGTISSFQALSGLVWRCVTRARGFPEADPTRCRLAIDNRARLQPPCPNYYGNNVSAIMSSATVGEMLTNDIGWIAGLLNKTVASHTDAAIRESVHQWMKNRDKLLTASIFDDHSIIFVGSPRFDMYGCDFGWGKAVAIRSGSCNNLDGFVVAYPGCEGHGSVDLEICLAPETMTKLLQDDEFMSATSNTTYHS